MIAVDTQDSRLEQAAALGAHTINPSTLPEGGVVEKIRELTAGGATNAVDTTAVPQVIKQGVQALAARGRMVVVGLGAPEFPIDAIDLLYNGKTVQGCIEGDADPHVLIPRLLEMRAAGTLPLDGLVTTYPFEDINRAVEEVTAGKVVKPVLVF